MRTFIAITLPSSLKEEIAKETQPLKKCNLWAKWVKEENLHITLKFLGEVKEEKLEEIKKIIEDVAGQFSSFEVNLKEFGFFPNERRPRVFFVSTDKGELLKNISVCLEEKIEKIGFPKEDRFKSHITLARFKGPKNIDCLKNLIKETSLKGNLPIKEITLMKSTLTQSGPIYEELFSAHLT